MNLDCTPFRRKYIRPGVFLLDRIFARCRVNPEGVKFHEVFSGPTTDTLCFYAHYDPHGIIDPYVIQMLEDLKAAGCDICFITASPHLHKSEREKLCPLVTECIHRKNLGGDFGSWKTALKNAENVSLYQKYLFLNDSVYGLLFDLAPWIKSIGTEPKTIDGIIDSFDYRYHLQSWAIGMGRDVFSSEMFRHHWDKFIFLKCSYQGIRLYEYGFSQAALRQGFHLKPLINYREVRDKFLEQNAGDYPFPTRKDPLKTLDEGHAMHIFWRQMMVDFSCPFIKRDLLVQNQYGVRDLKDLPDVISSDSNYSYSLIINHLERTKKFF